MQTRSMEPHQELQARREGVVRIHDEIVNVSEIRRGAAWHVTTENERGFDIRSAGDG